MIAAVFVVFLVLLVLSAPIAVCIGAGAIVPNLFAPDMAFGMSYILRSLFSSVESTALLAVPMFILSGTIMSLGGIGKKLFDVFAYMVGTRTGGMPCAVILTCLFFGALSGSSAATATAVGSMTIPVLVKLGYDKVFAGSIVATAAGLGVIIPPSIPFITYCIATGASVGDLFIAGIIPGILIGVFLMLYAVIYCRWKGEDKEKIKAAHAELKAKGALRVVKESFWALLTPVIILGGIYGGITTPTEAACISVIYALIVSLFIYKTLKLPQILTLLKNTVRTYSSFIMIIAFSQVFSRVLTRAGVPQALGGWLATNFDNTTYFWIALLAVLILIGMFMEVTPVVLIVAPMLLNYINSANINVIHLGIVMVCTLAIGYVTPPFGLNLFVTAPMINTSVITLGKKSYPFIIAFIIALLFITFIPGISLFLGSM